MRDFSTVIKRYCGLDLQVPDPGKVEEAYRNGDGKMPFPYWSRVWPSAIALAEWLQNEPHRVEGKVVLELGAGIGLPSLAAAHYARRAVVTDHMAAAQDWVGRNAYALNLQNVEAALLDWHQQEIPHADVLLLSDVGYDPSDFDRLLDIISAQIKAGGSVLLAVPARSVSVVFIGMIERFQHGRKTIVAEGVAVILFAFPGDQATKFI